MPNRNAASQNSLLDLGATLQTFLQAAPDAIIIVDREGRMVHLNQLAESMFGYEPGQLLGKPIEILLPERYRQSHVADRSEYGRGPKTRPMGQGRELAGRRQDASEFPVEISLSPLETEQGALVISIIRDLTDRHRVAKEGDRFTGPLWKRYGVALLSAFAVLVLTWNLRDILKGYPLFLCLAAIAVAAMNGGWGPALLAAVISVTGAASIVEHFRLAAGNPGQHVWLVLFIPVATLVSYMGTALRSALRRAHEARAGSAIDAENLRSERELRSRFIATLAHDLRTPLTAAKTSAQLLLRYPDKAESRQRLLGRVVDALDRSDQMIQNLLDANRLRAGERLSIDVQPCDLRELAKDQLEALSLVYGDHFRLEGEAPVEGLWDPDGIHRILENLCSNAVKYGAENTPILVRVSKAANEAILEVHNEGTPIPVELQESLFQPFRRGDSASGKKGWGLGLTIVRGLAEAHGGSIGVTTSSSGTSFIVRLPIRMA